MGTLLGAVTGQRGRIRGLESDEEKKEEEVRHVDDKSGARGSKSYWLRNDKKPMQRKRTQNREWRGQ